MQPSRYPSRMKATLTAREFSLELRFLKMRQSPSGFESWDVAATLESMQPGSKLCASSSLLIFTSPDIDNLLEFLRRCMSRARSLEAWASVDFHYTIEKEMILNAQGWLDDKSIHLGIWLAVSNSSGRPTTYHGCLSPVPLDATERFCTEIEAGPLRRPPTRPVTGH